MSLSTTSDNSSDSDAFVSLRMSGLTAGYGDEPALEGITCVVKKGGALALIGPNGAGKTTLIQSILGLVPRVGGHIEVLGTTPELARTKVAYVPQAGVLDREFPISVLQVVMMGRYRSIGWLRRPRKYDRQLAMDALEEVGLDHRAKDRFGTLSGGQRQRVLIARALVQGADLFLLDEPFNGVDTMSTDVVLEVLQNRRAQGVAVVMSTHDLSIAHLACDDACLLNRHQFGFGPVTTTLTPELLQQAYGGRVTVFAKDSTVVATG